MPGSSPSSGAERRTSAVVVNYNAGEALERCVANLLEEGADEVVVVDNGSRDGSARGLASAAEPEVAAALAAGRVRVSEVGRNLGYGGGANRGARQTSGDYLLVANPDLVLCPGALAALAAVLDRESDVAVVGPMLLETNGEVYPSGRDFPSLGDAVGHAFLGFVWGGNPWTRRYRHLGADQHVARSADWVSGAVFLARRTAFESVGGFDEAYFMYLEEVDLCWRLRRAGWQVRYEPAAAAVHEQGRSTSQHPYRMLLAHHASMWRFAWRTSAGPGRLLLPLVGAGLVVRLLVAWAEHLVRGREQVRRIRHPQRPH